MQIIRLTLFLCSIFLVSEAHAAKRTVPAPSRSAKIAVQSTARPASAVRNPASAREISEAIDITGQSRNLSMGLMFQRDKDKLSFGSPRTNYKDKITSQQTNY